jgi:hypothetical protein
LGRSHVALKSMPEENASWPTVAAVYET